MKPVVFFFQKLKQKLDEVSTVARIIHKKGWAEGNAGNISINLTTELESVNEEFPLSSTSYILNRSSKELSGNFILMSASGSRMNDLAQDPLQNSVVIKIDEEGNSFKLLNTGSRELRPTSEILAHLAIHEFLVNENKGKSAVLHTHVDELIAISHHPLFNNEQQFNKLLYSMNTELIIGVPGGVGAVPFEIPGSEEIGKASVEALKSHQVILWEKHGVLAVGNSLLNCLDQIEMVTKAAKIFFLCSNAGFVPEGLTEDQLQRLRNQAEKS